MQHAKYLEEARVSDGQLVVAPRLLCQLERALPCAFGQPRADKARQPNEDSTTEREASPNKRVYLSSQTGKKLKTSENSPSPSKPHKLGALLVSERLHDTPNCAARTIGLLNRPT